MIFSSASALLLSAVAAVVAGSGGVIDINLSELYAYYPSEQKQYFDIDYTGEVTIGTPPQKFNLLVDTGSPDTWVQGKGLGLGGPAFKPKQSSTFVNKSTPWGFEYGGPNPKFISTASGYAAKDTISIGSGKNKVTLKHETFAVAEKADGNPPPFSQGILGMTYGPRVSSYNAPVYVQTAIKRGLLQEHLYGIRLRRAQDAKPPPPATPGGVGAKLRSGAGKITLGGIDKSQFKGPITYTPIEPHKGFWQTKIDGIYVNNKLVESTKNFDAIADTGTSILVFPPKLAADFYKQLGGTRVTPTPPGDPAGVYTVPCKTEINVKVKIGGKFVQIKAQDLNNGYANAQRTTCSSKVIGVKAENASKNGTYPSHAENVIVLGVPFLVNTYSIFDYTHGGRLGFATLKNNGDLPAIAPLDVTQNGGGKASAD